MSLDPQRPPSSRLSESQKIYLQTNLARDKAEVLLQGLEAIRDEAQRYAADPQLRRICDMDAGQFAVERAIESTERIIDRLGRAMRLTRDSDTRLALQELDEILVELEDGPRLDEAFEDSDQPPIDRPSASTADDIDPTGRAA